MPLTSPTRGLHRGVSLAAALVALAPLPALAQELEVSSRTLDGSGASALATLARLLVALAFVLLAFWGCARLMRRLQGVTQTHSGGLRIVGGLSVGQRERLVVVQAGGERLLLGVSPGRIERLHVLETPPGHATETEPGTPLPAAVPGAAPSAPPETGDFRTKLLAAMQRRVAS